MGTLLLSIMGAFAEFERSLILERQREGISIAKASGKYKGRRRSFDSARAEELRRRVASGETKAKIARDLNISRDTLYRYLQTDLTN